MALLVAILLALYVLPQPWGAVAIVVGIVVEIGETALFVWWSKRRRAQVGTQTLVGLEGVALDTIDPHGQVRVAGEIWSARAELPIRPGARVRVAAVQGLTLVVEPCG